MSKLKLIKRFNASVLICLLTCFPSCLFGSSYSEITSDFTNQTDDWGGGASSFLSIQDAIDTGNSYLRKEINMSGGESNKNRMVIRRPVNSNVHRGK